MKCPECGAKYSGAECPVCGAKAPASAEKRNQRLMFGIIGGAIVAVAALLGTLYFISTINDYYDDINNQFNEIMSDDTAKTPATTSGAQATFIPATSEGDETTAAIQEALAEYADKENISVTKETTNTVVTVCPEGLVTSAETAPEDWDSIKSGVCERSKSLPLLPNTSAAIIYLQNTEGTEIYLTAVAGAVMFDLFVESAEPTGSSYGPGYMTLEIFNKIETGMSYQDVVNLVGAMGTVLSDVDIGEPEYRTTMYMWEGDGITGANANVMFQGGKVASKAQFGLE